MTLEEQLAPLRDLDPDALSLEESRDFNFRLLACVETYATAFREAQAEIHRLHTEVARLKGEHGPLQRPGSGPRPDSPASGAAPASPTSHSSERQRRDRPARSARTRKKKPATPETPPARTETLSVPKETLPPDAVFKG